MPRCEAVCVFGWATTLPQPLHNHEILSPRSEAGGLLTFLGNRTRGTAAASATDSAKLRSNLRHHGLHVRNQLGQLDRAVVVRVAVA
jgi:hypothetical protein